MSESTQPRARGPHSITPAIIGARLNIKARGDGNELARLIWLVVLSHTPWDGSKRPTYASNVTLGHEAGVSERDARRGLQRLKEADMLTTKMGLRPRHKTRKWGRILVPRLAAPVKILIPTRGQMTNIWITCREIRKRPASLVTLAVGLHALACHAAGHLVTGRTLIPWQTPAGSSARARATPGRSEFGTWRRSD